MSVTNLDIIKSARKCLRTPFRHQGRIPGVNLDCVGLVRWPVVDLLVEVNDEFDYKAYHRDPNPQKMKELLDKFFIKQENNDLFPGAILWLVTEGREPQHLALYTEKDTIIHCVSDGPECVVEHAWRHPWPQRLVAVYKYREVDYVC